jgi:peptide/nickel transport system permease protein
LIFLAAVILIGIIYPWLNPKILSQYSGDVNATLSGPSAKHLLGTDPLGRDVLQRLLAGTRVTLEGVAITLIVAVVIGVPIGIVSGFFRGRIDAVINWTSDLVLSMPGLIIQLVVLAVFPGNQTYAMGAFGVLYAPRIMRIVRSAAMAVREELYIDAAIVSGVSWPYILSRHVLPRVTGPTIVQMSLLGGVALQVETGLAFLGLLVPAPAPSWGGLIADGTQNLSLQPWLIWPGGLATVLTTLAFGIVADSLRDADAEGWSRKGTGFLAGARQQGKELKRRLAQSGSAPAARGASEGRDVLLSVEDFAVAVGSRSDDGPVLVEDVRFEVAPGEIVGLVGESGCGKTTTATGVIGLLPDGVRVAAGHIWFDGHDLAQASETELRQIRGRRIALISQEPMVSLNPAFRVGWQIAEVVRQHHPGMSRKEAKARAIELLRTVHLPNPEGIAARYPHELSGGMAQRVSIARALAGEPELLIADEPTTALDVTVQAEILDLLREIRRTRGMAILLITHDWGVLADICDRAVVMYAGQVVEDAAIDLIFAEPLHPYTGALLAANPQQATGSESGLLPTIPGIVPPPGSWPVGCHFYARCVYATDACRTQIVRMDDREPGRRSRCINVRELLTRERREEETGTLT